MIAPTAASGADAWTQSASWLASDARAIAVGPDGAVWVVTQGGSAVTRFTSTGTQTATRPAAGFLALDIDVDASGNVHQVLYDPVDPSGYVAVVGPDGQTRRTYVVPTPSTVHSDDEFEPEGIALDAGGNATLFESDPRVGWHDEFRARYDAAGQRVWKTGGEGNGALSEQTDIASAPDGTSFVLDQTDEQVHVYDPAGTLVRSWGQLGTEPGRTYFSSGLAVSPWGTVFITDRTSRVQEFTADGAYQGVVTTSSARNGGVDFGPGGELYVFSDDAYDGRILKYVRGPVATPPPTTPPTPGATRVKIRGSKVHVRDDRARVALTCAGPREQSCGGRARILGHAPGRKKPVTLARASYDLEVGKGVVKLKLTTQGRAALTKRTSVAGRVILTPDSGAPVTKRGTLLRR